MYDIPKGKKFRAFSLLDCTYSPILSLDISGHAKFIPMNVSYKLAEINFTGKKKKN